jgi:geranylgeranylglycerol-phosphate geranylgeranyltransferase
LEASTQASSFVAGNDIGRRRAFFELLHIGPILFVLLASAGFLAAAYRGWPPLDRLAIFLTAILLTQLAISLHNDYCDRDLDAETKPWRILPSGLVAPRALLLGAWALFAMGMVAAAQLNLTVAALVVLGTTAGFVYNAWLKRTAWSWVPFGIALPTLPMWAFAAAEHLAPSLLLAYGIGMPLALAVHLADTLPDVEADRSFGLRGLAHLLGQRRAALTCWLALAVAQGLALLWWPTGAGPSPLFGVSLALLLAAVVFAARSRLRRWHAAAIMGSATALGVSWIVAFAG